MTRDVRWTRPLVWGLSFGALVPLSSCVLADPPPDLPRPPRVRPTIVRDAVVPPASRVLTELPVQGFVIPVDLVDPSETFEYRLIVDDRPVFLPNTTVSPEVAFVDGGPRLVTVLSDVVATALRVGGESEADPTRCHLIEVVVAYRFSAGKTPDAQGGDSVGWYLSPNADVGRCTHLGFEAMDGSFPPLGQGDAFFVQDVGGSPDAEGER